MIINNVTDALTEVEALTDIGRKTSKARGTKEPLRDAREELGETMNTSGRRHRRNYCYSRRFRRSSYYSYKE